MKTKNFNKKLSLNKKTVADLNNVQLGRVMGYGTVRETALTYCQYTCIVTCLATCGNNISCYTDELHQCTCPVY